MFFAEVASWPEKKNTKWWDSLWVSSYQLVCCLKEQGQLNHMLFLCCCFPDVVVSWWFFSSEARIKHHLTNVTKDSDWSVCLLYIWSKWVQKGIENFCHSLLNTEFLIMQIATQKTAGGSRQTENGSKFPVNSKKSRRKLLIPNALNFMLNSKLA